MISPHSRLTQDCGVNEKFPSVFAWKVKKKVFE